MQNYTPTYSDSARSHLSRKSGVLLYFQSNGFIEKIILRILLTYKRADISFIVST